MQNSQLSLSTTSGDKFARSTRTESKQIKRVLCLCVCRTRCEPAERDCEWQLQPFDEEATLLVESEIFFVKNKPRFVSVAVA